MSRKSKSTAGSEKKADKKEVVKKETTKKEIIKKEKQDLAVNAETKQLKKVENKSVQNTIINNIKNFIAKIAEMQQKVKKDEEIEKKSKKDNTEKKESAVKKGEKSKYIIEYYDLPYRYNETVVKILAQTPKRLFVYWDVSDKDKDNFIKTFGEYFFEDTYPVLLVHNETKNYTSEVTINDFANSWYLDIQDTRDKYSIQLGRKFKRHIKPVIRCHDEKVNLNNDLLLIAESNRLEVPNDHMLFEEFKPYVKYRNVKNYEETTKKVDMNIFGEKIRRLYAELYNTEIINDEFDMLNPSSAGIGSSGNIKWS